MALSKPAPQRGLVDVACLQLNLHKAQMATVQLAHDLLLRPALAFLTEPYTAFGTLTAMPKGYQVFPSASMSPAPQAGMLVPQQLPAIAIPQFTTRDCSAVLVTLGGIRYLCVSGYLDITLPAIPDWLLQVVEYADSHQLRLIMGIDTNAHTPLFGGQDLNSRGEELEEFILAHDLLVHNLSLIHI